MRTSIGWAVPWFSSSKERVTRSFGPRVRQSPGAPTLLIYGHYDVQPVDPVDEWLTPPFEPTVREGKLYARGTADDKGQVFCLLRAYEAIRDENGMPPLNVHFIFEGEEECGGHMIDELLAREPERTKADVALVCDMSYYAPGIPGVYTALRGMCYVEISVRTLQRDLHSGTYGGVAPNAFETLVRLLAELKDDNGKINISKLYKSVIPPTKAELHEWDGLPFKKKEFLRDELTAKAITGLKKYSVFERTWALPTFEIHGIKGGFVGEGAKTVIPATATAKVSLRLVPGLHLRQVVKWLERAVRAVAPKYAEVDVKILHGGDPVQVDVNHPAFAVLDAAFREVVGRPAVRVRAGGSIPIIPRLAHDGCAGAADRYRAARRRAALTQREARPAAVVGRDYGVWEVHGAVGGEAGDVVEATRRRQATDDRAGEGRNETRRQSLPVAVCLSSCLSPDAYRLSPLASACRL